MRASCRKFSQLSLPSDGWLTRLAILGLVGMLTISGPVAAQSAEEGGAAPDTQQSEEQEAASSSGQADLDEATIKKLTARSMADLEEAIKLCRSALEKGLDADNEKYAKDLLKSTLYEHASRLSRLIFEQRPIDPRWPQIRQAAVGSLQQALEVDDQMGSAHLLMAKLLALPGGDIEQSRKSTARAIELLKDQPEELSTAILLRGTLTEDPQEKLKDYNRAVELNPRNLDALRGRGIYFLAQGDPDKALADLQQILEIDADDLGAHQALAQALRELKKFDEALEHLERVIETEPRSSIPYLLKAQILDEHGRAEEAIEALNDAVDAQPDDVASLLFRARLRTITEQFDLARSDIQRVLQLQPRMPQAILMRSLISAAQNRFGDAIADVQKLVRQNPESLELRMQLAGYYEADRRPSQAIEEYSKILQQDEDNAFALRRRADTYLSIGKQQEAIEGYEAALKIEPNESGILNNLAWVLATSPDDSLRDGARSLSLAQRACEITGYAKPHILSTLAASHAELGDFEQAIKWSSEAVALDPSETQLANELASYREQKPWRELQQTEEEADPLPTFDDDEESAEGDSFLQDDLLEDDAEPTEDQGLDAENTRP